VNEIIIKWVGMLITGLKLLASTVLARVFVGAGLTVVNFVYALPVLKDWVGQRLAGLPGDILAIIGAFQVDKAMVMILSAIVARIGLKMFVSTTAALTSMLGQEQGT
jgi:hypothetical protein